MAQIAHLKVDEVFIKVLNKYADFADIFSQKLTIEFPKHMYINDHAIELVDDWQPPYSSIYSLGSVELEMLKACIENNLANAFIKLSNSLAKAPIFFDKKPNSSLRLYVDYQSFNNLIIKNRYLLLLVGESLDQLGQV